MGPRPSPAIPALVLFSAMVLVRPVPADAPFVRADSNGDGKVNLSDPVHSLSFLFLGGPASTCADAVDWNDDGVLDLTDAVGTLVFLFAGGVPPAAPYPACGPDPTAGDGMDCATYSRCPRILVNIQVDAELEDVQGAKDVLTEIENRGARTTVYVSADWANRNGLVVEDFFERGHEIALHGFYSSEQLATMTYAEQKDLLTRAKTAVEGCQPCGTFKPVVGFRPQFFSQNEDTFRVLDELGLTHDSGFKVGQLFLEGHEWDARPYEAPGHSFSAVPITTVPFGEKRIYLCDLSCANADKMDGDQWAEALRTGLDACLASGDPLVILLHGWVVGDRTKFDYWRGFTALLDRAGDRVEYVKTAELVERLGTD